MNTDLGFWKNLKKPILTLAPMADITDSPFRRIIAAKGKPDVFFNEFISVDGLCSGGRKNLLTMLKFTETERPIVAQLFGANPVNFCKAAQLVKKLKFDGIDINMGCPFKAIEKQGAGAALIKNSDLAVKIIRATKQGAGHLPVSVKTRIGYNQNEIKSWIPLLLSTKPAVLTVHGRTRNEKSKIPAHWEIIGAAAQIAHKIKPRTLIIGNGDIKSLSEAKEKTKKYNLDGVMIGRAVWQNPWFFSSNKANEITVREKLNTLVEHSKLFARFYKNKKNFHNFRKFLSTYAFNFNGAKQLRIELMAAKNADEISKLVQNFLN